MHRIATMSLTTLLGLGSVIFLGCQSHNDQARNDHGANYGTIDSPSKQGAMPGVNAGPDATPAAANSNNHGNAGGADPAGSK